MASLPLAHFASTLISEPLFTLLPLMPLESFLNRQYGFDKLDFEFDGVMYDGKCFATVPLPEYAIAEIRTGQFVPTDNGLDRLWEAAFLFNEAE